jgi:hypothetical protein
MSICVYAMKQHDVRSVADQPAAVVDLRRVFAKISAGSTDFFQDFFRARRRSDFDVVEKGEVRREIHASDRSKTCAVIARLLRVLTSTVYGRKNTLVDKTQQQQGFAVDESVLIRRFAAHGRRLRCCGRLTCVRCRIVCGRYESMIGDAGVCSARMSILLHLQTSKYLYFTAGRIQICVAQRSDSEEVIPI